VRSPSETPLQKALRKVFAHPRLRRRIYAHAYGRTRNLADVKDVVGDAVVRILERKRIRVAGRPVRLLDALGSAINSCTWNRRQSAAAKREESFEELDARLVPKTGDALEALLERERELRVAERARRWLRALRDRLVADAEALQLVDLFEQGVSKRADQVEATGRDAEDVRNARRRIFHAAEAIKQAEAQAVETVEARPAEEGR
jgi:DNA-directed RNA polymerase specialized sigma24 family protein